MKHTPNRLINASSPYLLQHAYNPVDWHPWGEEALALAKAQDKPIIVSIGYSACHWCHVMERESFEQDDVAAVMNANYVCIKVDREERPDVDQVYMEAVQLMGANGGWPLNVILTPDAKPFYGGTYFPKPQWTQLLEQVADAFANHRDELEKSAQELTAHLQRSEMERYRLTGGTAPSLAMVERALEKQYSKYDGKQGGMNRAPKFPMPSLYAFLMRYGWFMPDGPNHAHALLTLRKMALGGIYDQVGGGFARYSVDKDWLVPHFEKMLYDNALLLSLYAEAYSATGDALFRETAMETAIFMEGMLQSEEGGFFSALDADSEGEEGKFYVWTAQELRDLLGEAAPLFFDYYQIQENGNWEHGSNILHRATTDEAFAQRYNLDVQELKRGVRGWKRTLWARRALRVMPGLDDKVLASWNGLALAGFADAYKAIGEPLLLELAIECAEFLEEKMANGQGLWHTYKNGTASVQGYLEDYAAVAQGYIALYQACFDEKWLHRAQALCEYALAHFYDPADGLFFFSDNTGEQLIARKKEIFDSVIPSSNALVAHNLYDLWVLLGIESYRDKAQAMVGRMSAALEKEMVYLSHWGSLILKMLAPTAEIAVVGQEAGQAALKAYRAVYMPNVYLSASETPSRLPLLQHRPAPEQGCAYYICQHGACQLPVFSHEEAEAVLSRMASGQ